MTNKYKIGTILHTSWGYSMTLNDYCKIVSISPTGKTVKCRMLGTLVENDDGKGNGKARPSGDFRSDSFTLRVRTGYDGTPRFVGQYPYAKGDTHRGNFSIWDGTQNYHNTWD